MNIILLSGGSGKRLWPLSNDIRSKQFIKLFKKADGTHESMLERVYGQLRQASPDTNITIATSKAQVSNIKSQLGDKVAICVEPTRRDTFPAILLAASYLHDEAGVSPEETIAVCPIDPYVEQTYYEAVIGLDSLVQQNQASLTLMGIEPTYPSEKYGYIIPETEGHISRVREFKEKPNREMATSYIKENALWNAGVFAFKLGYLLEKAHEFIQFTDYRDLYAQYEKLEKISFDYGFVEKESSIQVVRYNGEWKDVGTWNTMAEVMSENVMGKALLDEASHNTHVVNELNIPIIAMGCENMIIAASNDGILVADKPQSGYMKPLVEKVVNGVKYAEKSWGTYTVMDVQEGSMTVKISMPAGQKMSYHGHNYREEVWTIIAGHGLAIVDGMEQKLQAGDVITIAAGCKHTIQAVTDLDIIEVQIGENISVEDKVKFSLK